MYILLKILEISLIVITFCYVFKSRQVLFFKYENTYKEELLENFKPLKYYLPIILLLVGILVSFIILIPDSESRYTEYQKEVSEEKIQMAKNLITRLYTSNPADLSSEETINMIRDITTQSVEYKLDTRNLQNLRDRHLNYTSDKTKLTFLSETISDKELVLIYKIESPTGETKTLASVFEFYGDNISSYNEYTLQDNVVYTE